MNILANPAKLRCLADDLERISRGEGPSANDLARCPVLVKWRLHWRPATVLRGMVAGHQSAGPGPVETSLLFALDPDGGHCARTLNNWYLLKQGDQG